MATKLETESCLPGFSLGRDLNEDPNDTWSSYHLEKNTNDHLYDIHMQMSVNGILACDKETIRCTMIQQEAMFQKQVYELHRLYRIQKEMMDEFQTGGLHKSSVPEETSQSNSFSSHRRLEKSQMVWQSSHFPVAKRSYDNTPLVGTLDMRSSMSFMKEGSVQSGFIPAVNISSFKESEFVDHKVESQSRSMFDLRFTADAYIDLNNEDMTERNDEVDASGYKAEDHSRINGPQGIAKLLLGNGESSSSKKDECLFGLSRRNCMMTEKPSAINKSTTKTWVVGPEESASVQFLGIKTHTERNLDHHLTMRSKEHDECGLISKLPVSDFRHSNTETNGQFPNFTNNESGRKGKGLDVYSESIYSGRFSVPSEPLPLNLKKVHENRALDSNQPETWFKPKPVNGIETSASSSHVKISSYSGTKFPFVHASFPMPQKNFTSFSSSFVSSGLPLNGMTDHQVSAGELPRLNTSSTVMKNGVITNAAPQNDAISKILQNYGSSPSGQGNVVGDPYYSTKTCHKFDLNLSDTQPPFLSNKRKCMDIASSSDSGNVGQQLTKSVKDFQCRSLPAPREINLNQAPSATDDDLREQDGLLVENKTKDLSRAPFLLRKTEFSKQSIDLNALAPDMESSFSDDHLELPPTKFSAWEKSKEDKKTELPVLDLNDSLEAIDQKMEQNKASEHSNERPCSFQVPETTRQISLVLPSVPQVEKSLTTNPKNKEKDESLFNNLDFCHEISSSEVLSAGRSGEKIGTSYRNNINLNVELPSCDEEVLPNSLVECHMPIFSQTGGSKASSEIDLEVPICQDDSGIISQHESVESSERNSSREKEGSSDSLVRLAAETIVSLSMHQSSRQNEVDYHHISPCDSLHFFVEVALSNNEGTQTTTIDKGGRRFSGDSGIDDFEAMTLALEEVKVHDLCNKPYGPVNTGETDEEDIGVASQLFTRRRRGQARRRRQRKDFQKDILPGLVSLSRHEMTEDLQLIGELMKASGRPWQSGLGKRNSGRCRANSRAKGKRQLTNCSAASAETHANSYSQPPAKLNGNEPEVVGSGMPGWGRTTRRCRRQKSLPNNVLSPVA